MILDDRFPEAVRVLSTSTSFLQEMNISFYSRGKRPEYPVLQATFTTRPIDLIL